MPIALQYNSEKKIMYITIMDKLSLSELTDTLMEITHSDKYPPDVDILLDASSINLITNDMQFSMDLNEIRKKLLEMEKSKIAIITNDFTFGMGKKHELRSETKPENIMLFDNFMEAEEWIAGIEK